MTQSENCIECINRNGTSKPKQPVVGIPLDDTKKIILTISQKDVTKYGFDLGNVNRCLNKKQKSHKGYKWLRVNYKHNKKFRIK